MKHVLLILSALLWLTVSNSCYSAERAFVYFPFTYSFPSDDGLKNLHAIFQNGARPQQACEGPAAGDFFRSFLRPWDYPCFFTTFHTMDDLRQMSGTLHGMVLEIYLDQNYYRLRDTLISLALRLNNHNDPPLENHPMPRRYILIQAIDDTPRERTILGFDGDFLHPQNIIRGEIYLDGNFVLNENNHNAVAPANGPRRGYPFSEDVGNLELGNAEVLNWNLHVVLDSLGCGMGIPHNASSRAKKFQNVSVKNQPICSTKPKELNPLQFLIAERKYHTARILPAIWMGMGGFDK